MSGFSLVAEVYQRKEIFGIANAHGSNTYAEDFFSPVHTCQLPHMCDFYHITLCYDVPFTRQGEQSYRLTNIGYDLNQIDYGRSR